MSEAFAEDPLRVLRVARFAARYSFRVAPETLELMTNIVATGEIDHLTVERVWLETEKAFDENNPMIYLRVLDDVMALDILMPGISRWLNYLEPFIDEVTGIERQVDEICRLLTCMFECEQHVKDFWKSLRAPNNIINDACLFWRVYNHFPLYCGPSVDDIHNVIQQVNGYKNPEQAQNIITTMLYTANNGSQFILPNVMYIVDSLRIGSQVRFTDLSEDQQKTLKGPKIKKAIDNLRLEKIKQTLVIYQK